MDSKVGFFNDGIIEIYKEAEFFEITEKSLLVIYMIRYLI